jgi:hypothetical protein
VLSFGSVFFGLKIVFVFVLFVLLRIFEFCVVVVVVIGLFFGDWFGGNNGAVLLTHGWNWKKKKAAVM